MLGLGNNLSKVGISTPGIVTSNLVLKHNYAGGGVVPVSDGACSFTGGGTEDRMTITETEFNVDGADYTFAFWAKRNTITTAHHTILGRDTSGSFSHLRLSDDNKLKFENDTNTNTVTATPHTIDTNWHHYAITVTGSGATTVTYQDGVVCSHSGAVENDNVTFNLIGAQNTGGSSNEMDGYICNIGIWEAVLTQAQVKSIMWKNYAGLTSSETTSLIHWWNLDEGTGTTATDSAGGNTATFTTS